MNTPFFSAFGAALSIFVGWLVSRLWRDLPDYRANPLLSTADARKVFLTGLIVAIAAVIVTNMKWHEGSTTIAFTPLMVISAGILFGAIRKNAVGRFRSGRLVSSAASLLIAIVIIFIPMEPNIAGAMFILTSYMVGIAIGLKLVSRPR